MSVTLRIFFFGLMAFIQQQNKLTVALVDSKENMPDISNCGTPVSSCPFHDHEALLLTSPANLPLGTACAPSAEYAGLCAWQLQKAVIQFTSAAGLSYQGGRGMFFKHRLPTRKGEGRDFTWVPAMKDIDSTASQIDPLNIGRSGIADLVTFTGGRVQACHLADVVLSGHEPIGRSCPGGGNTVNVFKFESIDGKATNGPAQALADGVMVEFEVTLPYTIQLNGGASVVLQTPNASKCVIGDQTVDCVDVAITNMPAHIEECPGIGIDFARLYEISRSPTQACGRMVPRRTVECVDEPSVLPECMSDLVTKLNNGMDATSPDSRPVCPMVIYGG
jgi:hypothetical protein